MVRPGGSLGGQPDHHLVLSPLIAQEQAPRHLGEEFRVEPAGEALHAEAS